MPISLNTKTKDTPLNFARHLSPIVNELWENGSLMSKVTPVTQDLLRYWFYPAFCEERRINFHVGQKQAILNTIYCHEILKTESVLDMYSLIGEEFIDTEFLKCIQKDKYSHPKYCVKMATGTGKTWVLNALLIWQYLNAKYTGNGDDVKFSKNFLLVAPGLIVYERLLDAFLGKENELGKREFESSDLKKNQELFIPDKYRNTIFGFIQNSVAKKEEIGKKITGEGLIAITNWHLLSGADENEEDNEISPLDNPSKIICDLLPITPGTTGGNSLEVLDNKFSRGGELEYLAGLENICVFNDEAHHIHETKSAGIVKEVEWQESLNYISENKGRNFVQIDFSATPYDVTGSGQKRTKHYFPHLVVDFDLNTAIRSGLVKTITIDKREEIATLENEDIDFKAVRDGKEVIDLSNGQRLMLRAGLQKLKLLEEEFTKINSDKHPKMLVICEDTKVSPLVLDFLKNEGLSDDDLMQIDSDRKGSVKPDEWKSIKQRLFNIDKHDKPKVIVSVLMLREGFDVSNVCVIVPLRSSQAPILLEQVIGRGLRLMWREPDYDEIKAENRTRMFDLKQKPDGYYDILSIIEHPAFIQFYDDLENTTIIETKDMPARESILGDIIKVGLKENYKDYDFYWPVVIQDREETLNYTDLTVDKFAPMNWYSLKQLKDMVKKDGERFYSEEMTQKTRFGYYEVHSSLFDAKSYNEFLSKMMNLIVTNVSKTGSKAKEYPMMQINQVSLIKVIDEFIRTKLFNQDFNPLEDENWRVLILSKSGLAEHILKEVSKSIYDMHSNVDIDEAIVKKKYFSEVPELKMRENFALNITKTIYEKLAYPSNKGEFEKNFMLFCDNTDGQVSSFLKINENYHSFASLKYIRTDGLLASYYPDFIVKIDNNIYLVETKALKDIDDANVKQKQRGALDWISKINELKPEGRMDAEWAYVLLDENTFYAMSSKGASGKDIFEYCKVTNAKIKGTLF